MLLKNTRISLCKRFLFYLLANNVSLNRSSGQIHKSWERCHNSKPRTCQVEHITNICLMKLSWKYYVNYARGFLYSDRLLAYLSKPTIRGNAA